MPSEIREQLFLNSTRWAFNLDKPKRGEIWRDVNRSDTVRIMTDVVEGYVMVRYKGSTPFLVHISDWQVRFRKVPS